MAQTIKLKRSGTQNAVPSTSQLELGEVAINTYDGKMYIKKNDGSDSIVEIGGDATSSSGLDFTGNLNLADDVRIVIGDGNDLQIWHGGVDSYITNDSGHLQFIQKANDKDIQFYSDDGSGGHTQYMAIDGDEGRVVFNKWTRHVDGARILVGTGGDLAIYHDGSNSYISDAGTGYLVLMSDGPGIRLNRSNADVMIDATPGGSSSLWYDGSKKIETTSTGVTVTGTLVADGLDLGDDNILNVGTIAVDKVKGDADDNTNITFAGNDITAFYQGGAEKIRIDADGRLLINTTSSIDNLSQLHIVGPTSGRAGITLQDGDSTTQKTFFTQDGGVTRFNTQNDTSHGSFVVGGWNGTASVDLLRVTGDGRVGIGTNAPSSPLHINDSSNSFQLRMQRNSTNYWGFQLTNSSLHFYDFANSTTPMVIDSSGNVGIGTTSPSKELHIASTQPDIRLQDTDGTNHYSDIMSSAGNLYLQSRKGADDGKIIFRGLGGGSATEYARFDSSGNFSIGNTNSGARLVVQSNSNAQGILVFGRSSDDISQLDFSENDGTSIGGIQARTSDFRIRSVSNIPLLFMTNNTERVRIDASGNMLVGTTTADAEGITLRGDSHYLKVVRNGATTAYFDRKTSDGSIIDFRKNGTSVGTIRSATNTSTDISIGSGDVNLLFFTNGNAIVPRKANDGTSNNFADLGNSSNKFKNLYLAGQVNTGTISSGNITTTGYLRGPSTFTIDPAAHGDNTGTVVIAGNLQVDGTTTTINSTTLTVDDIRITLARNAANAAAANGGGIELDGANASILYDSTNDEWDFNKDVNVAGNITSSNQIRGTNLRAINTAGYGQIEVGGANGGYVDLKKPDTDDYDLRIVSDAGTGGRIQSNGAFDIDAAGDIILDADGGDVILKDGGNVFGLLSNDNFTFKIQNHAQDTDIKLVGNDGGTLVDALTLDMSAAGTAIFNSHVDLSDSKFLRLGNDADFIIYHDGSTNYVQAVKQDSDIIFRGNDGGTNFNALTLDMSDAGTANFNNHITLSDSKMVKFGNSADGQIYHDGSHFRLRAPTGNFNVQADDFHLTDANNTTLRFRVDADGATDIRYNGSTKLVTTSTGIDVTGSVIADSLVISGTNANLTLGTSGNNITFGRNGDNYIEAQAGTSSNIVINPENRFVVNTADTERMRIDSSGRVGIGTTSPAAKLHISGNSDLGDTDCMLIIDDVDGSAGSRIPAIMFRSNTGGSVTNQGRIRGTGHQGMTFSGSSALGNDLVVQAGKIGVGTTSPEGAMHFSSSSEYAIVFDHIGEEKFKLRHGTSGLYFTGPNTNTVAFGIDHNHDVRVFNTSGSAYAAFDGSTSRFAVGTTTPSRTFHVISSDYSVARLERTGAGGGVALEFRNGDGNIWQIGNDGDEVLRFYYAGSNKFQITSSGAARFNSAFTLPTSDGGSNQVLKTDGSGNVSWATIQGVGAPTYMEDADGDTKIQVEEGTDDDNIRFDTAGTQRMVIDSGGNFGFGVDVPTSYFHVKKNSTGIIARIEGTSGRYLYTGTDASGHYIEQVGTSSTDRVLRIQNSNGSGGYSQLYFDGHNQRIYTNGAAKVGIGTSSLTNQFHVSGNARIEGNLMAGDSAASNVPARPLHIKSTGANAALRIEDSTSSNTVFDFRVTHGEGLRFINVTGGITPLFVGTDGNVGVGTTSPDEFSIGGSYRYLAVGGDKPGIINLVDSGTSGSYLQFGTAAGVRRASIHTDGNASDLVFTLNTNNTGTGLTERFRIKASNGNVGIGNQNPTSRLHISGGNLLLDNALEVRTKDTGGNVRTVLRANSSNELEYGWSANAPVKFMGGGSYTERMRIHTNGNIGIGTNNPVQKLQVDGNIYANGGQFYVNNNSGLTAVGDLVFKTHNGSGYQTTMHLDGADNYVGIGTAAPQAVLDLGNATHGRGIAWGGSNGTAHYNTIWSEYSSASIIIGAGLKGATGSATFLNPFTGTYGYAAIELDTFSDDGIKFYTGADSSRTKNAAITPTERMRIGPTGRVGINTTSLTADGLKIGTTNGNCELDLHNTGTNGSRWRLNSSAQGHFTIENKTEATTDFSILDTSGNVGVGIASPLLRFHAYHPTTNVVGRFESGDGQVWIDLHDSNSGTYGALLGHDGSAGQLFMVADQGVNRRFIIDTSGQVSIGTNVNPVARLQVEVLGIDTTTTSTTATTQVAIDTMAAATFRSAKYTIQVTNSTDSTYHITEILLIHDGTTPGITEYGTVFTGSAAEATFDADISSGNVRLLATPASTDSMTFKVVRHCITV